jgi:hypothetical protein
MVHLTCECDRYHYGPACSLCRPGFSASQCDGTACAAGYLNGKPYGADPASTTNPPWDACAACDVANGYCATSIASGNGAFCALCSECSTANGALPNATLGTCTCAARFRGAKCDECLPQYSGVGCASCAPGYLDGARSACDACDTAAGYCGVGDPYTVFAAIVNSNNSLGPASGASAFSSFWLDAEAASPVPGTQIFLPDGQGSTTGYGRNLIAQVHDPHLSYCALCAECSPTFGLFNATNSTCTCVPRPRPGGGIIVPVLNKNVSYFFNGGPSCIVYNEGFLLGACFPGSARVRTPSGWTRLDRVATGTPVLAADPTGALRYTPIRAWWHHEQDRHALFLRLHTASGAALTLSSNHYMHVSPRGCTAAAGGAGMVAAALLLPGDVRLGDGLWVMTATDDNSDHDGQQQLTCSPVVSITRVVARGRFAPITKAGSVLVERVSASSLVALGGVPLPLLRLHHAAHMGAHAALGQLGLSVFDALHAPFYWALRVPQATNRAVALLLARQQQDAAGDAEETEQVATDVPCDARRWSAAVAATTSNFRSAAWW